ARLRPPAELRRRPLAGSPAEDEVGRAAGPVLDRDVRDKLANRVGDLPHADELVADEVVDPARAQRAERGDDALREVLDIHALARGGAVARDSELRPGLGLPDERRDHRGGAGARPVPDPETEDRRRDAAKRRA